MFDDFSMCKTSTDCIVNSLKKKVLQVQAQKQIQETEMVSCRIFLTTLAINFFLTCILLSVGQIYSDLFVHYVSNIW